jgi:hypothetical protein
LIETCKLNNVNPQTYLTDLLTRLIDGWPQNRIDELMPWHWAKDDGTIRISVCGTLMVSPCVRRMTLPGW